MCLGRPSFRLMIARDVMERHLLCGYESIAGPRTPDEGPVLMERLQIVPLRSVLLEPVSRESVN